MLARNLGRPAGGVAQLPDAARDVVAGRLRDGLAVVDRLQLAQLVLVSLDEVGRGDGAGVRAASRAARSSGPSSNAVRAAATARSTSASDASAMRLISRPVDGSWMAIVLSCDEGAKRRR
jgi:hypothetical protein